MWRNALLGTQPARDFSQLLCAQYNTTDPHSCALQSQLNSDVEQRGAAAQRATDLWWCRLVSYPRPCESGSPPAASSRGACTCLLLPWWWRNLPVLRTVIYNPRLSTGCVYETGQRRHNAAARPRKVGGMVCTVSSARSTVHFLQHQMHHFPQCPIALGAQRTRPASPATPFGARRDQHLLRSHRARWRPLRQPTGNPPRHAGRPVWRHVPPHRRSHRQLRRVGHR